MTASEIREKYLEFFKGKGHTVIPSASLVPENDPTVLFTTAGMHPLVPYLLGQAHPGGKRLVNYQKSLRTDDIDEVGDDTHNTFFEMLGNWSLGDYWKKEAIEWSYEFLTQKKWLGLDPKNLAVSVFAGDNDAPRDDESVNIWKSLGIGNQRIAYLPKKDNWWGPAGVTGPCGPDTEMFYWVGSGAVPAKFDPANKEWVEIWNDVFMQYNKTVDGKFETLKQRNVDTGMGLERITVVLQGKSSIYETELFQPILEKIRSLAKNQNTQSERIIADHLRAATFLILDGVMPSNKDRGYILRRLIRRAVRHGQILGIEQEFSTEIAAVVIHEYSSVYPELKKHSEKIVDELYKEEKDFEETLSLKMDILKDILHIRKVTIRDLLELEDDIKRYGSLAKNNSLSLALGRAKRMFKGDEKVQAEFNENINRLIEATSGSKFPKAWLNLLTTISGKQSLYLVATHGIPIEIIEDEIKRENEECKDYGPDLVLDKIGFENEFHKHQDLSRTSTAGTFKGGLADHSERTTRLHTATHLLQAGLRHVLGKQLFQRGSHITAERTRFDFNHSRKVSSDELKKVEQWVNEQISRDLPMKGEWMTPKQAHALGAIGLFDEKYEDKVSVYTISDPKTGEIISREFCGGPHVQHTGLVGKFKILKEEAVAAGIRRIKATVE